MAYCTQRRALRAPDAHTHTMAEPDAVREPFSVRLRRRTNRRRTANQAITNLTVPLALSARPVYALILSAYHAIFVAFEDEFEKRRRVYPRLNAVYFRELLRAKAFAADLSFYGGDPAVRASSPATDAFIADMRASLAREPELIIAYSYVLYMGLATASPRVIPWVRSAFDLRVGGEGVAVWDFSPTIHNIPAFKKAYNKALNAFPVDDGLEDRLVAQVHHVFEGSTAIFGEVKATGQYSRRVRGVLCRASVGVALLAVVAWVWFDAFKWAVSSFFVSF